MAPEAYEETLSRKEREHIQELLDRESTGYFKTLRLIGIIGAVLVLIVGLVATMATPDKETERPISLSDYVIASLVFFLLIFFMAIAGKKFISRKYRHDLKSSSKIVVPSRINRKQFIASNNSYYFHVDNADKLSIEVLPQHFAQYEVGDYVNVELARFSKTYLGYF